MFLTFIGTILLFTSCSKDNNKNLPNNQKKEKSVTQKSKLIGTWNITKISSENGKLTGTFKKFIPLDANLNIKGKNYNMTITFDKEKISNLGSFVGIITVSQQGITKSFEQKISKLPTMQGKWEAKDNKLTTEHLDKDKFIKIISLSEKKVIFSYPIDKLDIDKENFEKYEIEEGKISGNLLIVLTK